MIGRHLIAAFLLMLPGICSAQLEMLDTTGTSELKRTTTLFIIPQSDSALRTSYEQAINSSWTFTPHIIITPDQLADYIDKPGYSFFCEICYGYMPASRSHHYNTAAGSIIGNIVLEQSLIRQSPEGQILGLSKGYYSYYHLFTISRNSKGTAISQNAIIKMGMAKGDLLNKGIAYNKWKKDHKHGDTATFREDNYWNRHWNPGLLKVYLLAAGNRLASGKTGKLFINIIDTPALARLRTDTLYIPDYIAPYISIKQPDGAIIPDTSLTRSYPYPFRFVSREQLSNMVIQTGSNINFIAFSNYRDPEYMYDPTRRYNAGKRIAQGVQIYNSRTGLVYSKFKLLSDLHPKPRGTKHRYRLSPFSSEDIWSG